MYILSIDVGIKNLAHCLLDVVDSSYNILAWDTIDLSKDYMIYCNNSNCNNLAKCSLNNINYCQKHSKSLHNTKNIDQIKVFCLPRMLGYVFNPISVFVCFNKGGSPKAIMYQVGNTFNERYFYICKIEKTNFVKKKFYVSPFFKVEGNYLISFSIDKDFVNLFIVYKIKNKKVFEASFNGKSMDMNDKNLLVCFFSNMFQNFKLTLAIYIQALKLYFKGARYNNRPKKPKISLQ